MYATAKHIFVNRKNLTLDEKFARLIYSRFILVPGLTEIQPDMHDYAKKFYEQIKEQSQTKWDNLSLSTKFFEVCERVFNEENYYDNRDAIMVQRLGDLLSDLYMAEGQARARIWQRAAAALEKLKVPAAQIEHVVASDNPTLLAKLYQQMLK